ncbi:hypothetical protein [Microbulbifer discodermiae]|uniref:hypothetical protein n=1 Tax=Microbulbifer sp. 2201CG32-9 TaxID=3232309 RepID=UPI00345C039C
MGLNFIVFFQNLLGSVDSPNTSGIGRNIQLIKLDTLINPAIKLIVLHLTAALKILHGYVKELAKPLF